MSLPKIIIQVAIAGVQIFGRAFYEAGKQAVKNAKHTPAAAMGGDVAGVGNATSGSATDQLTRSHRMTLDEAHLILNVKRGEQMEVILKNYEHMFKANSPRVEGAAKATRPAAPTGKKEAPLPLHSHYLQSKVVRARERIEAELKTSQDASPPPPPTAGTAPPPPPTS